MFSDVKNWLRTHGTIILVLVFGLIGSLVLVWWRLGFTLEFTQFFAATPGEGKRSCNDDSDCRSSDFRCNDKGFCDTCGGSSGAQADGICEARHGSRRECAGSEFYCVSEGKGYNHCVEDTSPCEPGNGNGNGNGGDGIGKFTVSSRQVPNCATEKGGSVKVKGYVSNPTNDTYKFTVNVFKNRAPGCAATVGPGAPGGYATGGTGDEPRKWKPHSGGNAEVGWDSSKVEPCGRYQIDIAFGSGAGTAGACNFGANQPAGCAVVGTVVDFGIHCDNYQPPAHTVCQNNACVSVSGAGTNECSTNADCAPATHMVCQNNTCVSVDGAGTDECSDNTDCAPETHLVCQNNACVSVDGAGTDECTTNDDCGITVIETHSICQDNACVEVDGAGTDECSDNTDCVSETLLCQPSDQTVDIGEKATIHAQNGTGTYNWSAPSGSPSSGTGTPFEVSYAAEGDYEVTLTSGDETKVCNVKVSSEEVPLSCEPPDQTVDIGELAQLSAHGGSGNYEWSAPDGDPDSDTGSQFTVSYDSEGTYTVALRDTQTQETDECEVMVNLPETSPPTTTISGAPGLRIRKTVRNITRNSSEADSVSADPSDTVEFIIEVRSTGDDDALDVEVRDTLPSGLTYRSGTTEVDGDDAPNTLFSSGIDLGDMSPGETIEVRFRARVAAGHFFPDGTTVLVNTAYAEGSNTAEVSDSAFVTVRKEPANPVLALRKLARNVSRNEIGERVSIVALPNHTIEFTVRVSNVSNAAATNVIVQDVVPQGVVYQSGTASLNGQPSSDLLVTTGMNIGTLSPGREAVIRFLGKVAPANQLPEGTTTLINVARTWADDVSTLIAQLPVIIVNSPIEVPPVETGPGDTTLLALIISAIVTLMYIGYTSTDTFRRREAEKLVDERQSGDFKGSNG